MTNQLETLRQEIDSIDAQIFDLFEQMIAVAKQIGAYKKEQDLTVLDSSRETRLKPLFLMNLNLML